MNIDFLYVERPKKDTDVIIIFVNNHLIKEKVYVEPDYQYYRLFDKDDCKKHYKNHIIFEKNIENDIKKFYQYKSLN